jgi:hypothetical protein
MTLEALLPADFITQSRLTPDYDIGDRPVQPCGFRLAMCSRLGFNHFVTSMTANFDT